MMGLRRRTIPKLNLLSAGVILAERELPIDDEGKAALSKRAAAWPEGPPIRQRCAWRGPPPPSSSSGIIRQMETWRALAAARTSSDEATQVYTHPRRGTLRWKHGSGNSRPHV